MRLLHGSADDLAARVGAPLELAGIAVRRPQRVRDLPVDPALFTADAAGLVARDDVDLVVEVIGGIEPARTLLLSALRAGKSVVTANKALLAEDGADAARGRRAGGADLYYEARGRRGDPAAAPAARVAGRRRRPPGDGHRQRHHQLRAHPDGRDRRRASPRRSTRRPRSATPRPTRPPTSRASTPPRRPRSSPSLAFHTRVTAADVHREGITEVTAADVASAQAMGCVVKLLAIAERSAAATASACACTRR